MTQVNCNQHLETFSEILVIPGKLKFAMNGNYSLASLIFDKIFPNAVSR